MVSVENMTFMPIEFASTLTPNEQYHLLVVESARMTTTMLYKLMVYSVIAGLIIGVCVTIIYFKIFAKYLEDVKT